jgi:gliding motility-associated-like protein
MQWNFGDGSTPEHGNNPSHCYNSGNYDVSLIVESDSGCISMLKQQNYITVHPKPKAGFNVEPEELDENEPQFHVNSTATGANQITYFVNDQSTFVTESFDHTFKNINKVKPLIFQVVKNSFGCADTMHEVLKIKPSFVVYIPNTFTPNGDGINDGWFAKGVGITKFNVQVYDRWGHLLFETNDINNAWDGTTKGSAEPIKQDVYVWKAQVTDVFNKNHDLAGTVSLIP